MIKEWYELFAYLHRMISSVQKVPKLLKNGK